jgi:NAD(P)-dependent dehydrogenase (short-subunit alcohol dehydrogenase family)
VTPVLANKVVVITGGAGLIGRAFARAVVEHGGVAIVADRDQAAGAAVVRDLAAVGSGTAAAVRVLDITSLDSLSAMIADLDRAYGRIDAVVNNAYPRNAAYGRKFEDVTYADFCENVSTHLGGYFLTCQQFAEYFKKQGHGTIVNLASIYGVVAPRFEMYAGTGMTMPVEYAAIKAAVIQLTMYLAQYFKGSNIRVNCISPGGIENGQAAEFLSRYNAFAASKGMLAPSDVCGALIFLLSDMSAFVNGQNIVVDDGWTL